MRITSDRLEITDTNVVNWKDVSTIRVANDRLLIILSDNRKIELAHLSSSTVDRLFRSYENYLHDHPEEVKKKPSKSK